MKVSVGTVAANETREASKVGQKKYSAVVDEETTIEAFPARVLDGRQSYNVYRQDSNGGHPVCLWLDSAFVAEVTAAVAMKLQKSKGLVDFTNEPTNEVKILQPYSENDTKQTVDFFQKLTAADEKIDNEEQEKENKFRSWMKFNQGYKAVGRGWRMQGSADTITKIQLHALREQWEALQRIPVSRCPSCNRTPESEGHCPNMLCWNHPNRENHITLLKKNIDSEARDILSKEMERIGSN